MVKQINFISVCACQSHLIAFDSLLKSYVNEVQSRVVESGLFSLYVKYVKRYFSAMYPNKSITNDSPRKQLKMKHLRTIFEGYIFGVICSGVWFLGELFWARIRLSL